MRIKLLTIALILSMAPFGCDNVFEPTAQRGEVEHQDKPDVPPSKSATPTATDSSETNGPEQTAGENTPDESVPSTINEDPDIQWDTESSAVLDENSGFKNLQLLVDEHAAVGKLKNLAEFDAGENSIKLKKKLALSFRTFTNSRPLIIRTQGHDLLLVGHSFENLIVDSSAKTGPSGRVIVFSTGRSLPSIRSEGKNGDGGIDAQCPAPHSHCVPIDDRESRLEQSPIKISEETEIKELRMSWNDTMVQQDWRREILSMVIVPDQQTIRTGLCHTDEFAQVSGHKVQIEGDVILRQAITFAKQNNTDEPKIRDAVFVAGDRGSDGGDAGPVKILQVSERRLQREWIIPGGSGGRGGQNLKIPPTKASEAIHHESKLTSEELDLSLLKVKLIVSGSCAGEIGRRATRTTMEMSSSLLKSRLEIKSDFELQKRILEIPAQIEGKDLDQLTPTFQAPGTNGKDAVGSHQMVSNVELLKKLLPAGMGVTWEELIQSNSDGSSEKFSIDVLGLKTFPL